MVGVELVGEGLESRGEGVEDAADLLGAVIGELDEQFAAVARVRPPGR